MNSFLFMLSFLLMLSIVCGRAILDDAIHSVRKQDSNSNREIIPTNDRLKRSTAEELGKKRRRRLNPPPNLRLRSRMMAALNNRIHRKESTLQKLP
ncbi:unnamed protein product, partial [Mesorhabditis belari]|uniref:Secreted protein n=1 Tax=Mesorhabditis belari TaxID=2138241 RepID=A0AAF3FS61_9BILA